jgi:2-polyprenyl-6-hydroxyphenyl methylase/3-demethylubiquinone-9 3-methyltransferase
MNPTKKTMLINNDFYEELEEKWLDAHDHPVALLRKENALRLPWMHEEIAKRFQNPCEILDVGCGAGLLTNFLAQKGHQVHGIDLSKSSLKVAADTDSTHSVHYKVANAYSLPFPGSSFDVVCAMDVLEHVEKPEDVIAECARVLRPKGIFFFHTFNRNFLSWLVVIKGVEWSFSNAPENMHVYSLFIKPEELAAMCGRNELKMIEVKGMRPSFNPMPLWKMLRTKQVPEDFSFVFTRSLKTGYLGICNKLH